MIYLYEALKKPTRLYIKQCPHCGLKYFGKTVSSNIESYRGGGVVWTRHLKKYKVNPLHLWNSDWFTDKKITRFALLFSKLNNIVESKNWANIKPEDGLMGGDAGLSGNDKRRDTMLSEEWKKTVGVVCNTRKSETLKNIMNDPEWKATKGVEKSNKLSLIQQDPEWKATKGVEKSNKSSMRQQDPQWKATKGVQKSNKLSSSQQDPEWKATKGFEKRNKVSKSITKTVGSSTWKSDNYKSCKYCNRDYIHPGNYVRWHGDNCKMKGDD